MKKTIKIVKTFLSTYYAFMLEYRAELFLWALSGCLPFILMGLWVEAAKEGNFALNSLQFARYFLVSFIVKQFNVVWVIFEFETQVVQGTLSPKLLQPIDPVWHHVASHFTERLARFPFILGMILLFFALYPEALWLPKIGNFLLFLVIIIFAFALRFLIQYTFALLAFWTERANAIETLWFLFYLFLSGMIAPLEVFPETIREIALWTPFPYLIDFPSSLLIGLPVNVRQGLLVMLGWWVLFFICNRWLWRKGLRRYSGMGA